MQLQAVKYMLMAQDMPRAVAFYRDVMGFEESFSSAHWSELSSGSAILALHGGGDGARQRTGLSLQYADVASAYSAAIAAGATQIAAPCRREGEPVILGYLADPEGNEIMLTQKVSA